jgi:hypothetical protein
MPRFAVLRCALARLPRQEAPSPRPRDPMPQIRHLHAIHVVVVRLFCATCATRTITVRTAETLAIRRSGLRAELELSPPLQIPLHLRKYFVQKYFHRR